jgi:glycosyltransferase involved in cell wall biosynthesis
MNNQISDRPVVSVVIPVYNEEESLPALYRELNTVLHPDYPNHEIIFVNDGSSDRSLTVLEDLHRQDERVKIINFRRNFGQSAAMSAGFDYCSGEFVVTLDADLQNDPADIPLVIRTLQQGYDMVNGWRKDRKDKLFSRRIPSIIGNKLISFISKVKLHDYGCTLRGFRLDVVKNLKLYGEMHRYIPAIASKFGIRSIELPVNHRHRQFGVSKYGIGRTFRVVLDLISIKYLLSFSHRPLQVFGGFGFFMLTGGFLSGAYLTYLKFFHNQGISGRPLLFLTLLMFFLGFQMITLGLLAEMLAKIYHDGLNKTVYSVRSTLGLPQTPDDSTPPQ